MSFESPLLKAFLAGSLSGTFSTVLFQPLDLVKTRLQNQNAALSGTGRVSYSTGMFHVLNNILKKEQFTGLWKGMTPSITRTVPGVGLYFSSMHWMTRTFTDGHPSPLQAVAIGIVGRTFSAVCLIPITVVKTRYESGEYPYKSITHALRLIYQHEGLRGLTCGLFPTVVRDAPFSGIYLMFYTQLKKAMHPELLKNEYQAPVQFSCGVVAGILASLVTQPADVIKTKMQLYPHLYPNIQSVILHLHRQYGSRGYFKGLAPRMLRRTLVASMAWTLYEQVTRAIGLK
ncbi:solute carrier family 25 member 38-A-like isoform X2 [Cimex lectularius]|uniref:Mitochondrial glycine transporter n=1 Tax=Cimex lectularius TaxID=79782 RepID=A0A8I6SAE0_CIMLE|nr:solute carrier family 25 member 38-A-like isoform X2 [Cimex lectularius]